MATDDPMARLRTIDAGPDDTVDLADTALILAALARTFGWFGLASGA